jgi:branched-chain amino acid transport system substrate-binding protein
VAQAADHRAVKQFALALTLVAGVLAGCAGDEKSAAPVDTTSCSDVYYEGEGNPDAIIVSDLPREGGPGKETAALMVQSIRLVLKQRSFRAGDYRVGYRSCNDTVGEEPFDEGLCERNAQAYAGSEDVLGVLAPWNSGCTYVQLPVLSRKTAGPLAMVSAANTYLGLTRAGPGAGPGDPDSLYPDDVRNYVRVVPSDVAQGAALAHLAKGRRMRRVVSLTQLSEAYALGVTGSFLATARALGLDAKDFGWRRQKSYSALARRVAARRPELVYLVGLAQNNAKRLVSDLRAALGPEVVLAGTDAFLLPGVAEGLGSAGEGMLATASGIAIDELPPSGKRFLRAFRKQGSVAPSFLGAPEAAQAADVLLDAIARSDGSRASVVEELFKTEVTNGILGSFKFDRYGDIVPAPTTVYRFHNGEPVVERIVRAPSSPDN